MAMYWEELVYIVVGLMLSLFLYRGSSRGAAQPPHLLLTVCFACSTWWVLIWVQKVICWQVWHGRALAHGYGGDKSLSNLIVEPPLVIVLTVIAATLSRRLAGTRYSYRVAAAIGLCMAAIVVGIIPALAE